MDEQDELNEIGKDEKKELIEDMEFFQSLDPNRVYDFNFFFSFLL